MKADEQETRSGRRQKKDGVLPEIIVFSLPANLDPDAGGCHD
jgi:hypothetical protein